MNVVEKLIEVKIAEEEDFLKIKETLQRIGVASKKEPELPETRKSLYQSCHILHKQGRYYITHFKELFMLDGKPSSFTEEDVGRRNTIVNLLQEWGLVKVVEPEKIKTPRSPMSQIKIVSFKDKNNWILEPKYNIGKKKRV
jgi:hypothetical protein